MRLFHDHWNCVSGGKISLTTKPSNNYIGGIAGNVSSSMIINYTYYTSDLSGYGKYGAGTPKNESNTLSYDTTSFELSGAVSIGSYTGTSLIDVLNAAADYYTLRDYSHWLLNKGKNTVSFTINGRTNPIKMNYQIILLPSLADEGNMSFDGWYTDNGLTTPLEEFELTNETKLYGRYFCSLSNFTASFDVNGGNAISKSESTKQMAYDSTYGDLPTPTRTEATFLGWFSKKTGGKKIEQRDRVIALGDHTLYAHWSLNNYTVTFNPSGGSISQLTKIVTFDSAYGKLPTSNRTGYTFLGWFTEKNESITEESIVKTPGNHILYAHWLEITQSQVEIVFNTKDMGMEEVEEVIKKYTDDTDFKIAVIEAITDEIRVIIEFVDAERAKEFVRNVNAAPEHGEGDMIKRIDFVQEGIISFSPAHHPMRLL